MNIITLDFETYYDREFSLSKITTEEYVRDDRFEVIGVAVKENDNETKWFSGTGEEVCGFLRKYDWENSFALAHNAMFDASILTWRFGIKPMAWLDTLSMARAVHGTEVGNSLAKLVEYYELGKKGTEVLNALGKHKKDFSKAEINAYGGYCINDVDLTYELFLRLIPSFRQSELKLIDITIKMFSEPMLELDTPLLEAHLEDVKNRKELLLQAVQQDREALMSNQKFAELLRQCGVEPPTKISPTTGQETLAMAKSDEGFKALAEHPDERVQALVAARLGNKSTLEETRTDRFINISKRGKMPVPLSYYAAHTGRWGGSDKINLQNLPSRGANGGKLKRAIVAPKGYVMIDADSAQIEARVLAWLAGQTDLTEAFKNGEDVYKIMAAAIYGKPKEEITKEERFVGKTTILGAGYGMGAQKFQTQLKTFGTEINEGEARHIVAVYRDTYGMIPKLWEQGGSAIEAMANNQSVTFGTGAVVVSGNKGVLMPNGLYQRYPHLRQIQDTDGRYQYVYDARRGVNKIYGGKLVENICQGIARCIIGEQMIRIAKRYKVVLTVHDAIACVALEKEAQEAVAYVEECMKWVPEWALGLPLSCEVGFGKSYGEC
jgi:DNA polymerase I-like protein with 3'-5' exonuclease and polymerase domains